jgi:peroxiredoxin
VLAMFSMAHGQSSTEVIPTSRRKAAPDFTLDDSTGASIHLADYKGRIVLLDFWATWCAPCKVEMPWYVEFANKYKGSLIVIGVSEDEDGWKVVKPFIEEHKITYSVVIGHEVLSKQYNAYDFIPTTFLIDRHGKIAMHHPGVVDKNAFETDIRSLLDESESAN